MWYNAYYKKYRKSFYLFLYNSIFWMDYLFILVMTRGADGHIIYRPSDKSCTTSIDADHDRESSN